MKTAFILSASLAIHAAIVANESEIESLDRAIGDGDHYINMKRGTETVAGMYNELLPLPADEALNKIGIKLLSTIGGASGPLFASFFMGMAKVIKQNDGNNPLEIAAAFAAGVQNIMQRGKADLGEKTMLDVLIPVSTTFTLSAAESKNMAEICSAIKLAADSGLESTRNLIATKGRAAGLGERAIGHLDAGAKSCQVMVYAVCDLLIKGKN
ncbi:dihydroxyacetone kinase subunit DhaL [Methylotenera versatilis]|uniref:dihydroxyacetone kinase subunit DhaL n=1 Tax=Methylotenera versatilis TaxID=1055487 RepID=UPI00064755C2|nr:dihydroxyacetone kinase subunit DhaL [Methylotenera versatilis]